MTPPAPTAARTKWTGVCPPARGAVVAELIRAVPAPVWIAVTEDLKAAEQLAEEVAFFLRAAGAAEAPPQVLIFPESIADSRDMREAFAASSDRLNVLSRLRGLRGVRTAGPGALLVATTPAALLQPVPALEAMAERELTLTRGQHQPFQGLLEQLQKLDYDSEAVCESPGSYAVRGGIMDVYPVTANQPYRLDFFGDEIEEIRGFDPVTQRSTDSVATITLAASPRVRLERGQNGPGRLSRRTLAADPDRTGRPGGGVRGVRGGRSRRPGLPPAALRGGARDRRPGRGEPAPARVGRRSDLGHRKPGAPSALSGRRPGGPGTARGGGERAERLPRPGRRLEESGLRDGVCRRQGRRGAADAGDPRRPIRPRRPFSPGGCAAT